MEELIRELIHSIEQRDFWDYASIIAPFVLSFVATIISIYTAIKQNKIGKRQNEIALFESRIKVFDILNFLLPVAREVLDNSKKNDDKKYDVWSILAVAMQTYRYSTMPFDKHIEFSQVEYFYTNLVLESGSLPYLFKNEDTKPIISFLEVLNSIVKKVCDGEECEGEVASLEKSVCEIEERNLIKKLGKYLEL